MIFFFEAAKQNTQVRVQYVDSSRRPRRRGLQEAHVSVYAYAIYFMPASYVQIKRLLVIRVGSPSSSACVTVDGAIVCLP